MINKTRLSIFAILILCISITAVCAEDNSTFDEIITIENDLDEINSLEADFDEPIAVEENSKEELNLQEEHSEVLTADEGNFTELSDLINGSTTIELGKDYKYIAGDTVSSSGITIGKPITINGNGHTIDASDSARIFLITSPGVVLNNITFINGNAPTDEYGGAIYSNSVMEITNCNFDSNYARIGGAVYASSKVTVDNCSFTNNEALRSGACLYIGGSNSVVNNSDFKDNTAIEFNGGAMSVSSSATYVTVDNCNFSNSYAYNAGGALAWSGSRGTVKNSNFDHSDAAGGGSIFFFSEATYATVDNCTFSNDYAYVWGGSIYFYASYGTLLNSKFYSNVADTAGGAVYTDRYGMKIENCYFEDNHAKLGGGAMAVFGSSASITDNVFISNTADSHGGSIYAKTYNSNFDNLTFVNSSAASGGGMYFVYSEENTNTYSYSQLTNSRFINNTARYGGGGLTVTDHTTISSCNFTGNSAGSYGGAIDTTYSTLRNLIIENSSSFYGGAIYSYDSNIINVQLRNNHATVANDIYVLNKSNILDTDVLDENIVYYGNDSRGSVIGTSATQHQIDRLMETDSGYFAFCAERYNLSPYTGVHDLSMEKLKNSINNQPVADYLKILIYNYVDHIEDLRQTGFHDFVWQFTDYEYWNSDDPIVMEVIRLYDSGFRVPTENACKVLANGTLMYFNFSSMITPSGQQNLFLFKFEHGSEINETLTKEALNKTALVNDTIEYRIVVSNKGTSPIYYLWVEDKDYSAGLKYETWHPESGNWTYNNETQHWILDELPPAKSASLILIFRVMINGTLYNNATSGVGTLNVTNSSDDVRVYSVNLTVEKNTLTKRVKVGEITEFEIIVRNIGEVDLKNVFVRENKYDSGLVYLNYTSIKGNWRYDLDDDAKPRFTLTDLLKVGESASFRVIFNTTQIGNFSNTVEAGYNNTTVSNSTNVTEVFNETKKDNYTKNETDDNITSKIPGNSTDVHFKKHVPTENITEEIIQKNNASEDKIKSDNRVIDDKATGNPLILLLLALIIVSFRRFKN